MHQIFPLSEAACELEERYNDYVSEGGMALHKLMFKLGDLYIVDQLPKMIEWREYLKVVIDDYLNQVLHWTIETNNAPLVLETILPGYIPIERRDAQQIIASARQRNQVYRNAALHELERLHAQREKLSTVSLPPSDYTTFTPVRSWTDGDDMFERGRMIVEFEAHQPYRIQNEALTAQRKQLEQRMVLLGNRIAAHDRNMLSLDQEEQELPTILARQAASDKLYEVVLITMIEKVQAWVETALHLEDASSTDEYRWRTWLIQDVGDDIDIQMGEDFRILDWLQRTKGGRDFKRGEASHIQHGRTFR